MHTTTSITTIGLSHAVARVLADPDWGKGCADEERQRLREALIAEFVRLARIKIGDPSITYRQRTNEITYECWGETTEEHHRLDPVATWTDSDPDWGALARAAAESFADYSDVETESID